MGALIFCNLVVGLLGLIFFANATSIFDGICWFFGWLFVGLQVQVYDVWSELRKLVAQQHDYAKWHMNFLAAQFELEHPQEIDRREKLRLDAERAKAQEKAESELLAAKRKQSEPVFRSAEVVGDVPDSFRPEKPVVKKTRAATGGSQ